MYFMLRRFSLLILFLFPPLLKAVTLTLVYEDKPQPPFYLGETSEVLATKPGVAVEMVKMLADNIDGLEVNLKRMPWKRALYSLKSNRIDGIFNASYKPERLAMGWYPTTNGKHDGPIDKDRRIATISYSLYHLKSSPILWQGEWSALKQELVGAPLGYSIVGDLRQKGIQVEESNSTRNNLNMLMTGRLKVAALQTVTADCILSSPQEDARYSQIEKLTPPLISKPYFLMLSKQFVASNPVLSQRIWDEIRKIRLEDRSKLMKAYED